MHFWPRKPVAKRFYGLTCPIFRSRTAGVKGALSFISPQTRSAATNWLREVGYSCLKKERPPIVRPGAEFLSYRLGGFLHLHLICQY